MIRCSLENLVASCVKPIREEGCGGVWIEPSNYTCLRKVSIRDFRALLKPYKVEVHYVENPIVNGFNWYVTRETLTIPPGDFAVSEKTSDLTRRLAAPSCPSAPRTTISP